MKEFNQGGLVKPELAARAAGLLARLNTLKESL